MSRLSLAAVVFSLFACDNASSDRVAKLEARVAELEAKLYGIPATVEQVRAQTETNTNTLNQAAEALAWADTLRPVMSLDSHGDVAIIGVNLRIQSSRDWTTPGPEGKGNLIIGYDRASVQGTCSAGPNIGQVCHYDSDCDGDTAVCENLQTLSQKSGFHNLIVGEEHTYTGNYGLVMGFRNSSSADFSFLNGTDNAIEANFGTINGGTHNRIADAPALSGTATIINGHNNTATRCVVLSGANNSCDAADSAILGGFETTNGTNYAPYQILP